MDQNTGTAVSVGIGLALFGGAVWLAMPRSERFSGLGEGEGQMELPFRRPSARAGRPVVRAPQIVSTPVMPSAVNAKRYTAKKLYGTFVLSSQSALSMDKLANRGGDVGSWARRMAGQMREHARASLTLAKQIDPQWVASKGA
jgi:hypothetical protein